jgi:hypothetical protein
VLGAGDGGEWLRGVAEAGEEAGHIVSSCTHKLEKVLERKAIGRIGCDQAGGSL